LSVEEEEGNNFSRSTERGKSERPEKMPIVEAARLATFKPF